MTQARTDYTLVLHALGGDHVKKPQREYFATRPVIEELPMPKWVSYAEVLSPQPMEFNLHYRPSPAIEKPNRFQNLYFPNADVLDYEAVMELAENEDQAMRFYDMTMQGLSYNHFFAEGPDEDHADPAQTKFIVTADLRLFTFCANCALLKKAYHAEGAPPSKKLWECVSWKKDMLGLN